MRHLPEALAAMGAYKQFIVYMLQPSTSRPGKTDKFPCDFRTGRVVSAHQNEYWTDANTAIAAAATFGSAYGVGFTFTEQDPFWFLDIDSCLRPDSTWSPVAIELCSMFAGAAVEVSQSGTGLHIFGVGRPPAHGCKNSTHGLEFYHSGRFVALTGAGIIGSSAKDCSHLLPQLVEKYFPIGASAEDSDWTEGPQAEWNGPTDDDELIRRAMQSRSADSAFGNKASFADLWLGNVEALSKTYPDPTRGYDCSSADAALAQHLAFWTGNDCERILRLMERSGLVRDKYERQDYMQRTILKAISQQFEVLTDKTVQELEVPTASGSEPIQPRLITGATFVNTEEQQKLFAGCVYVRDVHRVLVPGGILLKPEQFKVSYGGYTFTMDAANEKVSRDAWEAFTQSQAIKCPTAESTCFKPDRAPGELIKCSGMSYVNTYWPVTVARKVGDGTPFFTHLQKVLPDERDRMILLSYMAACVQHQGVKFQWAPLLQGVEGNGKTLFTRCVAEAVGRRYVHWPKASQIASNFNGWLVGKVFYGVEDIYVPGERAEIIEILKPMITGGDGLEIERKGVDQINSDICGNFMFNSNHKDAVRKTQNDRRFCTLFSAQQHSEDLKRDGMTDGYFVNLYNWLREDGYAIVSEFLHTWAIPDQYNPATVCQRAPETTSTRHAIAVSTGIIEQEIMEAIDQGIPGFAGGWVSSIMLDKLLEKIGAARRLSHHKRKSMLNDMGYEYHPALPEGRVNNQVLPDMGKPRLFVHHTSQWKHIAAASEVSRIYERENNLLFQARV